MLARATPCIAGLAPQRSTAAMGTPLSLVRFQRPDNFTLKIRTLTIKSLVLTQAGLSTAAYQLL